jgi:hypothetical protein
MIVWIASSNRGCDHSSGSPRLHEQVVRANLYRVNARYRQQIVERLDCRYTLTMLISGFPRIAARVSFQQFTSLAFTAENLFQHPALVTGAT